MTIITHDFKRHRFLDLHITALKFPAQRVRFVGIDPPESVTSRASLDEGERKRGWGLWQEDLYGTGDVLRTKRVARGWKDDVEAASQFEEAFGLDRQQGRGFGAVKELLQWKGGRTGREAFPAQVPWEE